MQLEHLTKKNQDFIHIATKQLIADGKDDAEIKAILTEHLPQIVDQQAKGIPARSYLGAPTHWAASFSVKETEAETPNQPAKNTNPWLMWLDASLFWLGFLGLINAVIQLFNPNNQTQYGLVTLLIVGLGGGGVLYGTYHLVYRHQGKAKGERPSLVKSIAILTGLMLIWLAIFTASAYLPKPINPTLPPLILGGLGAIALLGRFYLKKKYNILSALTARYQ